MCTALNNKVFLYNAILKVQYGQKNLEKWDPRVVKPDESKRNIRECIPNAVFLNHFPSKPVKCDVIPLG